MAATAPDLEFDPEDVSTVVVVVGLEVDCEPELEFEVDPETAPALVVTTGFDSDPAPEIEPEMAPEVDPDVAWVKPGEADIAAVMAITAQSLLIALLPYDSVVFAARGWLSAPELGGAIRPPKRLSTSRLVAVRNVGDARTEADAALATVATATSVASR